MSMVLQIISNKYILLFLAFAAIFVGVCLFFGFFIEVNSLTRNKIKIKSKDMPEFWRGKKILFFSDLHLGKGMPDKRLYKFVEQMKKEGADLILFGGDLSEKAGKFEPEDIFVWRSILSRLRAPLGMYAVKGNHDTKNIQAATFFTEFLNSLGVTILDDESEVLEGLLLIGLQEMMHDFPDYDKSLKRHTAKDHDFAIVLLHQPDPAGKLAQTDLLAKPGLFLSGHSHNGQIRPFNLHLYKERHGRDYPFGLYDFPETENKLYTSRGLGTVHIHARFAAPPEYVVIELA